MRDTFGAFELESFLTDEEIGTINLKNNAAMYPILLNRNGGLRVKDNYEASTLLAKRGDGTGKFASGLSALATLRKQLIDRAEAMTKKAQALMKQADEYVKRAEQIPLPEQEQE